MNLPSNHTKCKHTIFTPSIFAVLVILFCNSILMHWQNRCHAFVSMKHKDCLQNHIVAENIFVSLVHFSRLLSIFRFRYVRWLAREKKECKCTPYHNGTLLLPSNKLNVQTTEAKKSTKRKVIKGVMFFYYLSITIFFFRCILFSNIFTEIQ